MVSLFILTTATFALIHLTPGDPVRTAMGGVTAPPDLVEARRHTLGLDRPLREQYVDYLAGVAHGDFGESVLTGQPVSRLMSDRLPTTIRLVSVAFAVTVLVAYPLGLALAVATRDGRRRRLETGFTAVTGAFQTIPEFLLATGLIVLLAVELHLFPVSYEPGPKAYVLPVISLTLGAVAFLSRIIRVEALKVLGEDYIRTARSKRLPARMIYLRHALPNMLTASLTVSALFLSGLVAGTVLVENVFGWPGLGSALVDSVIARDYPVAQALILLLGTIVLTVNLVVDLALAALDPRSTIRES
jgi:peptide/nickel transport system permease protein